MRKRIHLVTGRKTAVFLAAFLILGVLGMTEYRERQVAVSGTAEDKRVALTFDDGPHPYYTAQLLDGLKERNVKATFFVLGEHAAQYPDLIRRMSEEGHLVGNHTYSHIQLGQNNAEKFKQELIKTNQLLEELTGQEIQYVRPPYGTWDRKFERELNMFPVLWTVDPLDWSTKNTDSIVRGVESRVKDSAIILLHDEYMTTVTAALRIVDDLQAQGYAFVTVEELLLD